MFSLNYGFGENNLANNDLHYTQCLLLNFLPAKDSHYTVQIVNIEP